MQSTKENRCVSKGDGSTKKRVYPNVTQQYTPGDDSRYTVNDWEVSLSKTVDNKSIQKNSEIRSDWKYESTVPDRMTIILNIPCRLGNRTVNTYLVIDSTPPVSKRTMNYSKWKLYECIVSEKEEKKSDVRLYVCIYTRIPRRYNWKYLS